MSTTTTSPLPQSSSATATRRVPPPCWTKEETLALIEAYKDKWFALRRGNLKASDWDTVSDVVSSASDPGTLKSSVQCRHKIEKLRKRYRAEKQRSLKNSGKFSSSWDLYPLLDSMNFASTSVAGSDDKDHTTDHKATVIGGGGYDSSFNFDDKLGSGYGAKWHENEDFVAKGIKNFKSNGRIGDGYGSMVDFDRSFAQDVDSVGEFPLKTLGDRSFLNVGFKPKNYGCPNLDYDYDNDSSDEEMAFRARDSSNWDSVPKTFHQKKCGRVDWNSEPGGGFGGLNGVASCSRQGLGRKNASAKVKRGVDPVDEMVSSIKLLAEGFVRMEKMKMEMVKEIEKTRMEMELKHNEMILESQQKIMDAFSNALSSKKKKRKRKPSSMFPNTKGNGVEEWQEDALIKKEK
ncbi:putative Cationic amino acid transporter [Hibiscus syriacus]|uniref:Cationic amino acid transporter n=1 Tax=Hibiscus syriacus TaxID=106335 RepID=A0A6A2YWR1_HIBSY|nr:putative Cationic amino acid transporter [Hibiscus syriacus]